MPKLSSTFWKIDKEEFSWELNLAIERCRMKTMRTCPVKFYDYATANPKHVGRTMEYSNEGPLPIRFDLNAFRKSGRKAIIFEELRFDATRDTYLKQKQELETDGFALTPPRITLLPPDENGYTEFDPLSQPISVELADHGSISHERSNGNERFECSIIRKLGSGSACGVGSARVRDDPSEDPNRVPIDLLCSEDMPAELFNPKRTIDLLCSEDMPAELVNPKRTVDSLCSTDIPAKRGKPDV